MPLAPTGVAAEEDPTVAHQGAEHGAEGAAVVGRDSQLQAIVHQILAGNILP